MRRFALTIVLSLLAMLMHAQEVTNAEISAIRAAYRAAKQQVELNEQAVDQNVPRNDMEITSHYVIPGCGPTEEVIHYYFKLGEDPNLGIPCYNLYFISRTYNVAARKFYQEFLFDEAETDLMFFFQSNDAMDGATDETRYYFGNQGVHKVIKGNAELDEVFASRLSQELKNAFNLLMNRDY